MSLRFPRPHPIAALRATVERDRRVRFGAFTVTLAVLSTLALLISPPPQVEYGVGQVTDRAIRSPRSLTYVSQLLTDEARERAAEGVARVYRRDPSVATQQVAMLTQSIGRLAQARVDIGAPFESRLGLAQRDIGDAAQDALAMTSEEWSTVASESPPMLRSILTQEVRAEDLDQTRADVPKSLPPAWSSRQRRVASELVQRNLAANSTSDPSATERARAEARARTEPVVVQVLAGEVVVRDGAVVTARDVEKLRHLGLQSPAFDWKNAIGLLVWSALIATMLSLYLLRFQYDVWADTRRLLLVGGALLLVIATSRVFIPGHTLSAYLIPFAAVGMALAILIGGRTALVAQTAAALQVGLMSGQVDLIAYVLLPTLLGMATLRSATTARDFVVATTFVALGNLGVIATTLLLGRGVDVVGGLQLFSAGVANAVLSGLLAFAAIVVIGHLTRITTVFELRELGDPNHPLLRQLLLRTPGTYHHSLLVANLAERAAEVIGANPLVARVGAYYHDVGKMRNPSAFIENQAGGDNPHDQLDPLVSAQIVAAHVRDGLALAERYRLPAVIREMIPGHHGTGLVKYFFQEATARGTSPDPEQFRYPGPKPQSREAGVVMLADGVEASVRSLPAKTQDEIRRMVDKIVGERLAEGQLDECELTLADIQRIKDAFVELLVGVYHERIPYPEDRITQLPTTRGAAQA